MGREIITIFGFKKPSQTEFWLMVEEDANQQPPSPLSLSLSQSESSSWGRRIRKDKERRETPSKLEERWSCRKRAKFRERGRKR